MLKRLDIENFRILQDFHAEHLGRVNLIVGKNNAGKSTVLEAIRIFAGNAQRSLLETIAREHDERFKFEEGSSLLPFQDYFSRNISAGRDKKAIIRIGDLKNSDRCVSIQNAFLREYRDTVVEGEDAPYDVIRRRKIEKLDELGPNDELRRALEITRSSKSYFILIDAAAKASRQLEKLETSPCGLVPTRLVSMEELAQAWDSIVFSDDESLVKEAIRFISPDFEALTFVEAEEVDSDKSRFPTYGRRRTRRVPMVKIAGTEGGQPLKGLGDGVSRIFQLSLKLLESKDGYLLIDEFENGIHYSIQEKIWNYIFSVAQRLNVQVFATTHSWDCIESFAKASKSNRNTGSLFRVGQSVRKSDGGRVIATEFYGEDLARIAQSDLEVR